MHIGYFVRRFGRLFWGEQPPFVPSGAGGGTFFRGLLGMNDTSSPPPPRKFSCALALVLIVLLLLGSGAFLFWRIETWPMRTARDGSAELERLGRQARDAFVALTHLQPRVTINDRVYFERTREVAELALASRQTEVEHEFLHTWAGSTKRVKLHGTFNVKAGFDLQENFSVDVREKEIVVEMPHAKVLSVEQLKVDVLELQNGLWNRITAEDLQKEFAALPALARQRAAESDLLQEAETTLQKQLAERIGGERPVRLAFPLNPTTKP